VEPSFQIEPNDQHPPHDDEFWVTISLAHLETVSGGKDWNSTLLVIRLMSMAVAMTTSSRRQRFRQTRRAIQGRKAFTLIGMEVRIPTLLISPYIEPGTVFRSPTAAAVHHTSILATIRDWLQIPSGKMLSSARIEKAQHSKTF